MYFKLILFCNYNKIKNLFKIKFNTNIVLYFQGLKRTNNQWLKTMIKLLKRFLEMR